MSDLYKLLTLVSILIFLIVFFLSIIQPAFLSELFTYFGIKMAARRLKLRDKGVMRSYPDPEGERVMIHIFCNTRLRIGMKVDGSPTQYCWCCEQLGFENYGSGSGPEPDGGEPIPDDVHQIRKDTVVVPFKPKRVA